MTRANLILCVSQEESTVPYQFNLTGIHVYTMEEAVFHCYHYWKQSLEECCAPALCLWVKEALNLPFLASKMAAIHRMPGEAQRLLAFLGLFEYFDQTQMAALEKQLSKWQARREWERLKEQGDYLMRKGEHLKAAQCYMKALEAQENPQLLNNLALAFMACFQFEEAVPLLERAVAREPQTIQLLLNLAESCIYSHQFEKALRALGKAETLDETHPDIQYLYGELSLETGQNRYCIDYFEKAIAQSQLHAQKPDPHYIFRLADAYVKLRQYDKAFETLKRADPSHKGCAVKLANLYLETKNAPAAIKAVERALLGNTSDVTLWTLLATCYRLNYDTIRAHSAVIKALSLDGQNPHALLEMAHIKKAMGKQKDYQQVLHSILVEFKQQVRHKPVPNM